MNIRRVLFPSFKAYNTKWLRSDFMAALVVTAIAIPESLGFAVIVGLPVQTGLYCALLAPVIFAIFTSSRRLVVGADSATAALVAAGGALIASAGTAAYADAIGLLGILTALVLLLMAVAKLGFLADLISKPVLIGFISGVGLQLLLGKLPELLGIHAHGNIIEKMSFLLAHLSQVHMVTLILSAAIVAIIVIGWKYRYPGALIALVLAIVATKFGQLHEHGIEVVGSVPAGLPTFHIPSISFGAVTTLLPVAASIAVVILAQSLAVIRNAAARHDEKTNDNQDLMALGLANATSAMIGGFAINGSPPRTSAGEMAGGRSQLVNIMMSALIAIVLVFATGLFEYVPAAALAAVVFTIGIHLFKLSELLDIFRVRKSEFAIAMIALAVVAVMGVQKGVMIAVVLSLIDRLRRQYHPHDEVLVRDQAFTKWASDRLSADRKRLTAPAGVIVYRFNDALFFENTSYFIERVQSVISSSKDVVRYFVIDAGAITDIDYTAAFELKRLCTRLSADDIQIAIAHASPHLQELLSQYDITPMLGDKHIHPSVRSAIKSYISENISHKDRIKALKLDDDEYVVISGTAMDLLGIRKTHDVDLVVSQKAYDRLRKEDWKEFVQDDGKRVLSQYGYKVMTQWMGRDLDAIKRDAHTVQGLPVMSLETLIDCKRQMGRAKDIKDIRYIRNYRQTQAARG